MTKTAGAELQGDVAKLALGDFPETFGLWMFKDKTFRVCPEWYKHDIYASPMRFVVQVNHEGRWLDFATETKAEIYRCADNDFRKWITKNDKWDK